MLLIRHQTHQALFLFGMIYQGVTKAIPLFVHCLQVSNGAECILLSKQFLVEYLDTTMLLKLRNKVNHFEKCLFYQNPFIRRSYSFITHLYTKVRNLCTRDKVKIWPNSFLCLEIQSNQRGLYLSTL